MKLHWIVALSVVLAGALMLVSEPVTTLQRGNASAPPNVWGGNAVSMAVTPQGATLEFDCAHGNMLEPIKANAKGEFKAPGTYSPEQGGPVSRDNSPSDLPAIYKGSIDGNTMQLEIILADQQQAPKTFTLTQGKAGHVVKCR